MDDERADTPLEGWFEPPMRRRLVAFARRFVGDRHEAEDIAQETLLRASQGRQRLRSGDRAEAWLFRICRHAAIDHVRSRRVRRGVWCSMPEESDDWVPEQTGSADSQEPVPVEGACGASVSAGSPESPAGGLLPPLEGLPAHQRLLLELHYHRGLGQATLCRLSGLSASALRVRLFRARRRLLPDLEDR